MFFVFKSNPSCIWIDSTSLNEAVITVKKILDVDCIDESILNKQIEKNIVQFETLGDVVEFGQSNKIENFVSVKMKMFAEGVK